MASIRSHSSSSSSTHLATRSHSILGSSSSKRVSKEEIRLRFAASFRMDPSLKLKASAGAEVLAESIVIKEENEGKSGNSSDPFNGMKQRFLCFKQDKFLKNLEHFEVLAKSQTPKFAVIACADSRVCPSIILGFEPGEAFILRNVANLVPPFEKGPSETNAALEFAVNALEVENILVIGHSCCGGIRALMSMDDKADSRSFISNWVIVGKTARENIMAAASTLGFDQQCRLCEKESVNCSLTNLLTYPWIEEKVAKGVLSLHGGYYDFIDCTFEKWTLNYRKDSVKDADHRFLLANREFWS
ncbi:hypothetical protein Droror1_Dr00006048 [Drosera rotundifolia]